MKVCECGRIGVHCPQCGSVSKNGLAQQTILLTATFRECKGLRAYRCRSCPTQYIHCDWDGTEEDVLGWNEDGSLKKGCFAPKKSNISALPKQNTEDAEAMVKAFALVEAAGFKVVPKDAVIVADELVIERVKSNGEEASTATESKEVVKEQTPLTFEEMVQKAKEHKDENNPTE